jgi:broad specificity phosphatase PhoE
MATYLTLIRHGETDWNRAHRWQGMTDIPLNKVGEAQAHAAAVHLGQAKLEVIVTSPLLRAHRTAQIISQALSLPLHSDERLKEIHAGEVEGLTMQEIQARYPQLHAELASDIYKNVQFPGGESRYQVGQRMAASLNDIARTYPGQHILVATHGGSIRMVLRQLLSFEESATSIQNCSLTRLVYEEATQEWGILDFAVLPEQVQW